MEATRQHWRKVVGGICLIAGPALFVAEVFLRPGLSRDSAEMLSAIAGADSRFNLALIVGAASLPFVVVAILALMHLVRERQPLIGDIGGGLVLVGLAMSGIFYGLDAAVLEIARTGTGPESVALAEGLYFDSTVGLAAFAASILASVGVLVLAVALYRAEAVPLVSVALLVAFPIASVVGYATFTTWLVQAASIAAFVALAPVGFRVLVESDEEWEHPPYFRGYRPIPAGH